MNEDVSEDKPKKRTYKRKYTRKPKPPVAVTDEVPITDCEGMEAIVEPEKVEPLPVDQHRGDLDAKAITMDIVPSVGPALNDDFIATEPKDIKITMQNTSPKGFPWQKPKEKKTIRGLSGMISMSSLKSRRK